MSSIPKWWAEVDGQIQAKFQAQEVRIDVLESQVEALEEALKGARRAFKELDAKISDGGSRRQSRKSTTPRAQRPPTGSKMHVCNVPDAHSERTEEDIQENGPTMHSPEELQACWTSYYSQAKA